MAIVRVALDSKLLQEAGQVARRQGVSRSALIRAALREYLNTQTIRETEERDRKGYKATPADATEGLLWEAEGVWPVE